MLDNNLELSGYDSEGSQLFGRVQSEIEKLERRGEKARTASFIIIPKKNIWRKIGNRTFYHIYGLHYFSRDDDPKTCGVQKAIDKAHSKIFVKDATYPIATPLILKTKLTLEGESRVTRTSSETVLQLAANDYLIKSHTTPTTSPALQDITLRNLMLDGNKSVYATGKSLLYGTFRYCLFDHLTLINGHEDNISLIRSSDVDGYAYSNWLFDVISNWSDACAFHANDVTDSHILSSSLEGSGLHGCWLQYASAWDIGHSYIGGGNLGHDVFLDNSSTTRIGFCDLDGCSLDHARLSSSFQCDIAHNKFLREGTVTPGYCGVRLINSYRNTVSHSQFARLGSNTYDWLIKEEQTGAPYTYANIIKDNIVPTDIVVSGTILKVADSTIVKDNPGYVTENSGTVTVASGHSSVAVTHGLAKTPIYISVEAQHPETTLHYETSVGPTTFMINVPTNVTANRAVYWKATC